MMNNEHVPAAIEHELSRLKNHWWWFVVLGVILIIGGTVAIAYPFVAAATMVIVLGTILIICGVTTIVGAFWAGRWSAFLVQLLIGILYVVTGMVITDAPAETTAALTLLIASFLIIVGVFRIVAALTERFAQWGWALANGIVSLMAGIIIYRTFPVSALWIIGLLVGLELIFNGVTWMMMGLAIHGPFVPRNKEETPA
jgi:uncharacterized membrane protein HdeD (DUF308 family)